MRRRPLLVIQGVALVCATWGNSARSRLLALSGEPGASQGPDRLRIARRGLAVAGRIGGAVAQRRGTDFPVRGLRASPRAPRRRRSGLVARAGRFARCRARGHAPLPAVTGARPVRRGRGAAPRSPWGLRFRGRRGRQVLGTPYSTPVLALGSGRRRGVSAGFPSWAGRDG